MRLSEPAGCRRVSTVLSSWKEIASYLGKGVRTVQRWERELRLPVHRPAGARKGVVVAFPGELSKWARQTEEQPASSELAQPFRDDAHRANSSTRLAVRETFTSNLTRLVHNTERLNESCRQAMTTASRSVGQRNGRTKNPDSSTAPK
jgi:hypothetical protein